MQFLWHLDAPGILVKASAIENAALDNPSILIILRIKNLLCRFVHLGPSLYYNLLLLLYIIIIGSIGREWMMKHSLVIRGIISVRVKIVKLCDIAILCRSLAIVAVTALLPCPIKYCSCCRSSMAIRTSRWRSFQEIEIPVHMVSVDSVLIRTDVLIA